MDIIKCMRSKMAPERIQAELGNKNRKKVPGLSENCFAQSALKGLLPGLNLRQARICQGANAHGFSASRFRQGSKRCNNKAQKNADQETRPAPYELNLLRLHKFFLPCGQCRPGLLCDGHIQDSYTTSPMGTTFTTNKNPFSKLKKARLAERRAMG